MSDNKEIWREMAGTDGKYEASDHGRVRVAPGAISAGLNSKRAGMILKPWLGDRDFKNVAISGSAWSVAACVLSAFVGPRPSPDHNACYLDGNRLNVQPSNLAWLTLAQNRKLTRMLGRSALRPSKMIDKVVHFQCRKCEIWLPAGGFYELKSGKYRTGVQLSQCGLHSECRKCMNTRRQLYRQSYGQDGAPSPIEKIEPLLLKLDGIEAMPDEITEAYIASRIVAARRKRGLNRSELARYAGVAVETIDRLEKGMCVPRATTLRKIIGVLRPEVVAYPENSLGSKEVAVERRFISERCIF